MLHIITNLENMAKIEEEWNFLMSLQSNYMPFQTYSYINVSLPLEKTHGRSLYIICYSKQEVP